jgi:hypothetical protein
MSVATPQQAWLYMVFFVVGYRWGVIPSAGVHIAFLPIHDVRHAVHSKIILIMIIKP